MKQLTVEQVVHEPQSRPETVEVLGERVQQQAVERMVDKSIPQSREESVAVVEKFPQEPISERICEQREVIEVTETASQDQNLQRTVQQTVLDFFEGVKIVHQKRISEWRCEQLALSKCPRTQDRKVSRWSELSLRSNCLNGRVNRSGTSKSKISGQESVMVTSVPQEQSSERMGEQIG